MLQATNRLGEAEPLMRRMVEILLKFTQTTGHQHPHLMDALNSCAGLLMEMGDTKPRAQEKLRNLAEPYGLSF